MSRIGNKPIPVPAGVKLEINNDFIRVTGSKGTLEKQIMPELQIVEEGATLLVKASDNSKRTNAFRGLTRSLINNMIIGSHTGFKKTLIVEGVGYRVNVNDKKISLSVGYSNTIDFVLPANVSATTANNQIVLESIDKDLLGQTAAKIRDIRKPEPYKGKGIRYENEHIVRKAGKAAGKK
ncbi:MAG: 50S ribosomal protein L6 [Proteobacteria bacterium]|nr:50S ribosomal protein L6 [Desulfobulbaceae bacterium]MBU4154441.1 50S ribosomal protein L6 [Pseudomonadota bacterium]